MKRGKSVKRIIALTVFLGFFLGLLALKAQAQDGHDHDSKDIVPKITVHELKKKLDADERVIVLDMRVGGSYTKSKVRIEGDVRMPLQAVEMRARELPMGYEIVTYCT